MGSCAGAKCGAINSSSLLPELEEGNQYPGNTACVESCGGPGCDRFYPSSESTFNRKPCKIFHFNRWASFAKVEISHFEGKTFRLTLTSLALPPIPLFNTHFISDSPRTAVWKRDHHPALRCPNFISAEQFNCEVFDECTCVPAELHVNCRYTSFSIADWFNNTRNHLPVVFPALSFFPHDKSKVQARVSSMVSAEIVVTFQTAYKPEILIDDATCRISDSDLRGCYGYAKGAFSKVTCLGSRDNVQAEVRCNEMGFTIPCNTTGATSTLRFAFTTARISLTCSVSCGNTHSSSKSRYSQIYHGSNFRTMVQNILITMIGLAIIVVITYIFLSTCGMRILIWIVTLVPKIFFTRINHNVPRLLVRTDVPLLHQRQVAKDLETVLADSLTVIMVDSEKIPAYKRKEWLENGTDHSTKAEDVFSAVTEHMQKLDQYVAAIEAELAKAERRLKDEKCWEQFKRTVTEGQAKKMEVEKMDADPPPPAESLPSNPEMQAVTDEYLDRLIRENKGMEEEEDCRVDQKEHYDRPSDEDAPGPSHRQKSENWGSIVTSTAIYKLHNISYGDSWGFPPVLLPRLHRQIGPGRPKTSSSASASFIDPTTETLH
ncbi:hypothetical protein COOONC_00151 [Cooperia oncophora]